MQGKVPISLAEAQIGGSGARVHLNREPPLAQQREPSRQAVGGAPRAIIAGCHQHGEAAPHARLRGVPHWGKIVRLLRRRAERAGATYSRDCRDAANG
jgi:hypothetical protein